MTKKILLLLILSIFLLSIVTLYLILNYLDPYQNEEISFISITITSILSITSFFSLLGYLFKKVYYRGEVFLEHIFSSLRQGFLVSLFFIGSVVFYMIGVFSFSTLGLLFVILIFIEMMFQNMS